MKPFRVALVSKGDFEEVSIEMNEWQHRLQSLVSQRRSIKYDPYTMPNLSKEIQDELARQEYVHRVLESDDDQQFLMPT